MDGTNGRNEWASDGADEVGKQASDGANEVGKQASYGANDVGARAMALQLARWAPESLAESWDNPGWMFGDPDLAVTGVLVSLDLTGAVIAQAMRLGANLIVTHHPPVFSALRAVTADSWEGRMAGLCWQNHLCVYSAHTNFDAAPGGLCDILAETMALRDVVPFPGPETTGLAGRGRWGLLPEPMDPQGFCRYVSERLATDPIRLIGPAPGIIRRIVVQNGAYDRDLLPALIANRPDAVLTGDVKYHDALTLAEAGLFVVDAGHQATEQAFCGAVASHLKRHFPEVAVHVAEQVPVYRAP